VRAQRQDTLARGDFGKWIVKHIDRWLAFARRLGLGIEQMEEIIFVTGCDRTRSWANIAFLEGQVDAQASFGVNVIHGAKGRIDWQFSPERVRGALLNQGPGGKVWVRKYTVSKRR